jgi:hypothetical protein
VIDWNAISAMATLAAVIVALFYDPLRRWRNSPKLELTWRSRDTGVLDMDPIFDDENAVSIYRLLVRNAGREAAQQVEVIVNDLYARRNDSDWKAVYGFIPTALKWTHSGLGHCEYLPGQSERLCDFGVYKNVSTHDSTADEFEFMTIVRPKNVYNRLPEGTYLGRLIATAINCKATELLVKIEIGPTLDTQSIDAIFFKLSRASKSDRAEISRLEARGSDDYIKLPDVPTQQPR